MKSLVGPRARNARFLFATPLAFRPGHFYSPICDPTEVKRRYRSPASTPLTNEIAGIDLADKTQVELWESWQPFLTEARSFANNDPSRRYREASPSYDVGDAIVYACMLKHLQPRRVIEVGSGSSSAVALDACDRFLPARPRFSFIEPYPELLNSLLTAEDKRQVEVLVSCVQDIPARYFANLEANDILFIDSTHVVKTCSDVVYELFELMPKLRSGVVVHFHDVSFEYPPEWVLARNYSWNELYVLRAFLMDNQEWEIMFFNDYFARAERDRVARDAPEILKNPGGGLWLRRR